MRSEEVISVVSKIAFTFIHRLESLLSCSFTAFALCKTSHAVHTNDDQILLAHISSRAHLTLPLYLEPLVPKTP